MLVTLLLAIIAILLLVAGQTCLKLGLNAVGGVSFLGGNFRESIAKVLSTPYVLLGFVFYGISAVLWLDVLSKLDFSFAFPLVSMTYIFSLIIGRLIFHETITWERVVGVLCICVGVLFIMRSQR
ncbi:MAG: EamA family transporter [Anaerolineae bacterium]